MGDSKTLSWEQHQNSLGNMGGVGAGGGGDTAILGKKVTFENYRLSPPPSTKFFWELGFGRGVGGECVGEGDAFLAAIFNIYQIDRRPHVRH